MFVGFQSGVYWGIPNIHRVGASKEKVEKTVAPQSELGRLGTLELKLELVRNQGDELRIGGLSLGVADGVAEESLQGVQIPPVPGNLDGVADGSFHPAGCGAEVLGHLRVEHLGDGVDHIHVIDGDDNGLP